MAMEKHPDPSAAKKPSEDELRRKGPAPPADDAMARDDLPEDERIEQQNDVA